MTDCKVRARLIERDGMTIIEEATADAVEQLADMDGIAAFIAALRVRVREWLDAHANDVVFRLPLGLWKVRVRHVRSFIEALLD